ncbi:23S rRNA m(6)A-1618 methyltransferase [Maribacter vaceletii]|uniref:Ribosomal RNA large subunit methyltransferase F n=1 Tax=Maribacter vaceletii TaxID=1206816 RepID=A0A495E6B2_9FLAO|nr:23S rRNA (adenine(1618)-N(6))-methyltransferase RlmF [Maribacter vaceletii]RKR12231.1 23S rRNA m(6)A-1618 methyltransferase [Maribacter vaceletii]
MGGVKRKHPKEKATLHIRSKHRNRYDFEALIISFPDLKPFVQPNAYNDLSINFFDPQAVKMLNTALLMHYYKISFWEIPSNFLCPPIPGRADYIHNVADVLYRDIPEMLEGDVKKNSKIKCLDIGVGANCIYPIIGEAEYGWNFIGSDIDKNAIEVAENIIAKNAHLSGKVELRKQSSSRDFFKGIIKEGELFDLTVCNPPFHGSIEEAQKGTRRKLKNLRGDKKAKPTLNFGGQANELWCDGGEMKFVKDMIYQSRQFANSCLWFSTLVSKESNLPIVHKLLEKVEAKEVGTLPMGQGNKISRVVIWTFLSKEKQKDWRLKRWG